MRHRLVVLLRVLFNKGSRIKFWNILEIFLSVVVIGGRNIPIDLITAELCGLSVTTLHISLSRWFFSYLISLVWTNCVIHMAYFVMLRVFISVVRWKFELINVFTCISRWVILYGSCMNGDLSWIPLWGIRLIAQRLYALQGNNVCHVIDLQFICIINLCFALVYSVMCIFNSVVWDDFIRITLTIPLFREHLAGVNSTRGDQVGSNSFSEPQNMS